MASPRRKLRFLLPPALLFFLPLALLLSGAAPGYDGQPADLPLAEMDGSLRDADGLADGIWTVDGSLAPQGRLVCGGGDDDSTACDVALRVKGDLEVPAGSGIESALALRLEIDGDLVVSRGAYLAALDGGIEISVGGRVMIDGLVSASSSVSGGAPATITIKSVGEPGQGILLGPDATIISEGDSRGGNGVELSACGIEVLGLVAAVSAGPQTWVALRSCEGISVDGRDLGPLGDPTGPRRGRIEVSAEGGSAHVDLAAEGSVVLDGSRFRAGGADGRISVSSRQAEIQWRQGGAKVAVAGPLEKIAPSPGARIQLTACQGVDLFGSLVEPLAELEITASCEPGEEGEDGEKEGGVVASMSVFMPKSGGPRPGTSAGVACTPDLMLLNETVTTIEEYVACNSITAENFRIIPRGYVVFRAGQVIILKDGFSVEGSSYFEARLDPSLNQPPEITSDGGGATAAKSVVENTTMVTDVDATDPEGDTESGGGLTYSLSGDDAALFTIDGAGMLSFLAAPSFETPMDLNTDNDYEVTVTVTDSGGVSDSQDITVSVTDANDDPVITSSAMQTAAENQTSVATLTATDEDLPSQPLTWMKTGAGADDAFFSLSAGGVLTFVAAPDFETKADANADGVYEVEVAVDDGAGGMATQTVLVTVTDANDPPVITSAAMQTAAENQTSVATLAATDVDLPSQPLTWMKTGAGADDAFFSLSAGGVLTFVAAPDFETKADANADGVYEVEVVVNDGAGGMAMQTVLVTVTDVNDDPVITSSAMQTAAENQTSVATLTSTDEDLPAQPLTWMKTGAGADDAFFSLSAGGVLTFVAAPDFETKADANADGVYEVEVKVDDGAGGMAVQTVLVTVTDVNDDPVITSSAMQTAAENQTSVATLAATDEDLPAQPLTWMKTGAGADDAFFSLSAGGVLTFVAAPDFETKADANADGVYEVEVKVDDGAGGMATQTVLVTVTDVNEDPMITSNGGGAAASVSVAENTTAVTDVDATDPEGETESGGGLLYSLSGDDALKFTIDAAGMLSFLAAPDFETPMDLDTDNDYEVTVTVTDSGLLTDTQDLTVTVTNAPLVVNSTLDDSDLVPGDELCATTAGPAVCTLRAAIEEANASSGPDVISFDIPGSDPGCVAGVCTIKRLAGLWDIFDQVTIDGSTQPGNAGVCTNPIPARPTYGIVLEGVGANPGLRLDGLGALPNPTDGSVIRGLNIRNFTDGIAVVRTADARIECNFLGTNENGGDSAGLGNKTNGVTLIPGAVRTVIGGPDPEDGNLISGNTIDGVQIIDDSLPAFPDDPDDNYVLGNFIGTEKDGTTALGNGFSGVSMFVSIGDGVDGTMIGVMPGPVYNPNVLGANGSGVYIGEHATNTVVAGNFIGTDLTGTVNLGNTFAGIDVSGATTATIGGTVPQAKNTIAFNTDGGVVVRATPFAVTPPAPVPSGITISQNSIYSNLGLGIDLGDLDGPTVNDAGDPDGGPNLLQNFPDIDTVVENGMNLDITYSVDSVANFPITVEFFVADADEQEGLLFLGADIYAAVGAKTASVPKGMATATTPLVATATDSAGNTSEFSFDNSPPTATDDSYKTLGNTLLEVDLAAPSGAPAVTGEDPGPPALYADVLDNDTDAETPAGLTASLNAASVTAGAVVTMNADGSFSYLPPVDLTGTDTFEYTVTDAGGLTDVGMVTVDISTTMIWYVDNANAGTADGRSSQPYTTLAPIDAGGADDGKDGTGDTIFVFKGTGTTTGGILLEDNQILHGNGVALDPAGFNYAGGAALVPISTRPTITDGAGDVIDLASGNTVRGLNVSSSAGRAIDGSSIAGATIDGAFIGSAGAGTGVHFSGATGAIAITNLDVLANTGSGIDIQGGSATFTFDSSSSVTSPNSVAFNVNGGTSQVTYSGDITQGNTFPAVSITGHSNGAGTGITFQTGTIAATSGSGLQFSNADGTYNFNGTTTLMGGDAGIDILGGSNGNFTFAAGTTINNPMGIGVNIDTSTGGAVNYNGTIGQTNAASAVRINAKTGGTATFSGAITANTSTATGINLTSNSGGTFTFSGLLDIDTTTGTGFNATGGGTVQAANAGNTVTTVGDGIGSGIGVNLGAAIGVLGVNFNSVDVGSSGKADSGILLTNTGNAGAFNVTGGTIQNTTVRSFDAANVDGTVSIGASLQNDGGRSVEITSGSAGTFTFSGAIDEDAEGIDISSNGAGGTLTFRGGIDIDTIGTATGLRAFSGGTLNICADSNCSAAGGTAVINTIDVGAATALVVDLVNIGSDGLTFQTISANGGTNGIVLDTTGAVGGLTVTGIDGPCGEPGGTTDCDGGTIQNTTGDGLLLEDTDAIALSFMRILAIGNMAGASDTLTGHDGIDATDVNGLTLVSSVVESISDSGLKGTRVSGLTIQNSLFRNANRYHVAGTADGTGSAEATLYLRDLSGTNLIKDSKLENGAEHVDVENNNTDLTLLTIQGNDFGATWKDLAPGPPLNGPLKGKIGVDIIARGSSSATVHIGDPAEASAALGNTFTNHRIASLRVAHFDFAATGQIDAIISRNVFDITETTPAIFDYAATGDQPQGGVALVTRGTTAARLNAIFSHNSFDFTQNADGRVGSLSVLFDGPAAGLGGEGQVRANNNSFNFPYGAAIDVAEDGTSKGVALFDANVITGGPVPAGLPFAGFPSPAQPIEIFDQGSGGTLHTVWQNMSIPTHDTGFAPGSGLNFTRNNSGSTCTALSNVNAVLGFDFNVFAGTKTLEQGASAVTTPLATVIANNGNVGAVTNANGTVTVTGPMGTQVCDRPTGGIF